jgi:hypothetical protein
MKIKIDSHVRGITRTACYHLSGIIAETLMVTGKDELIIFKDRILFRKGFFSAIAYNYQSNLRYSNGIIDYVGFNPPSEPDNVMIFNELYRLCGVQ